jgi:cytochrome P450
MDSRTLGDAVVDTATYRSEAAYHNLFTRLRRETPLAWAEPKGYRPFWVVTKHADIRDLELRADEFINAPRTFLMTLEEEKKLAQAQAAGITPMGRSVAQLDGGEHKAIRGATELWFAPANLNTIKDQVRRIAREAIDDMLAHGGSCDFVRDVALWYPLRVIMLILGLPREDESFLLKLTQETFSPSDPDTDAEAGVAGMIKASRLIQEYFAAVTADRRRTPRDDAASVISNAKLNGAPMSDVDIAAYYLTIITAGHDTTSSTTAGGLLALLQNPGEFEKLKSGAATVDSAVSEFLRWTTPLKHFFRTAAADTAFNDIAISAGQNLMVCYPSGNRDEGVFADPFAFRIDRKPNPHLTFGYGPHICLGQHLARLEMRTFYEEFMARIDHVELAGPTALTETNFVQGLKQLPITFRPK